MSTHDINGREYARVDQVRAGTQLVCDDGFTCLDEGHEAVVIKHRDGTLCIRCRGDSEDPLSSLDEFHALDGQLNDAGTHYVGLYLADQ